MARTAALVVFLSVLAVACASSEPFTDADRAAIKKALTRLNLAKLPLADAADAVAALDLLASPAKPAAICAAAGGAAAASLSPADAAGAARLLAAGACPPAAAPVDTIVAALTDALASGTVTGVYHGAVGASALAAAGVRTGPSPAALEAGLASLTPLKRSGGAYADEEGAPASALASARVAAAATAARAAGAAPPLALTTAARRLLSRASPDAGVVLPGDGDPLAAAAALLPVAAAAGDAGAGAALASYVVSASAAAASSPARAATVLAALDAAKVFAPVALTVDPATVAVPARGGDRVVVRAAAALGGGPAPPSLASITATLTRGGKTVATDVALLASPGSDDFSLDLGRAVRSTPGAYDAVFTAHGAGGAPVGVASTRLALVQGVEFVGGAAGLAGAGDLAAVKPGASLSGTPIALTDTGARFKATASVATVAGGAPAPLAVFGALLTHESSGATAYVAGGPAPVRAGAAAPPPGEYAVSLTAVDAAAAGATAGGEYGVTLVGGGEAAGGDGLAWRVATITLPPSDSPARPAAGPLPTIDHAFRPPAKRAPALVAVAFSALTAAPLALLVVGLSAAGANLRGLPTAGPARAAAVAFQAGLGAVLALYALFWVKLNLLQLATPLALVGGATAVAGHRALAAHAASKVKSGGSKVE